MTLQQTNKEEREILEFERKGEYFIFDAEIEYFLDDNEDVSFNVFELDRYQDTDGNKYKFTEDESEEIQSQWAKMFWHEILEATEDKAYWETFDEEY